MRDPWANLEVTLGASRLPPGYLPITSRLPPGYIIGGEVKYTKGSEAPLCATI